MLRLAIIDDEEETRQIMVNFIDWETYGITVIGEASDGYAAYDLIATQNPDIVLIDIQMPGITGLDVLEKIRSEDKVSPAFIIMSGYDDFAYAKRAISLSAVEYLLKPFRPDDVVMAVQKATKHLHLLRSYSQGMDKSKSIDFSLVQYPSREERRLLDRLKVGTLEEILEDLEVFWNCLCAANPDVDSRLSCAMMLYVEIYRFFMERSKNLSTPYFDQWDSGVPDPSGRIHSILQTMLSDAYTLLTSGDASHSYINNAILYIQDHYRENLSLEKVANEIDLSAAYLSSLFTKVMGTTFINYVQSVRIEKAKELLACTTMKVYEIAYQIGYDDEKYFSTVFRKAEGITPSQFRTQTSKNHGKPQ